MTDTSSAWKTATGGASPNTGGSRRRGAPVVDAARAYVKNRHDLDDFRCRNSGNIYDGESDDLGRLADAQRLSRDSLVTAVDALGTTTVAAEGPTYNETPQRLEVVAPPEIEKAPSGAIDLMAALRASVERARDAREALDATTPEAHS